MNRKLHELARRLRDDSASTIDYPTIAFRSEELGFPTSVRTLRFYVSEGILPPPRKQGKSPVYPEDWILSTLLAIHLMKGRFQRTLAEIRAILEGLTDDPERLAEKCVELHELERATPPAEYRRLVEQFFARLSGGTGGDLARRQPSELSLDALREEALAGAADGGAGRAGTDGDDGACVEGPDLEGSPAMGPRGSRDGRAGRSAPLPARTRAAGSDRTRRDGVGAGRSADDARRLEDVFLRRFVEAFGTIQSLWHAPSGGFLPIGKAARTPRFRDDYDGVARQLFEERVFARDLFESLPYQKRTVFEVAQRALSGRRVVAVVAASWSPIAELIRSGSSARPLTYAELGDVIARVGVDEEAFLYLGVHAPCGVSDEVKRSLSGGLSRSASRSGQIRLAVVECDGEEQWRLWHDFPEEAAALAGLFDPQGDAGRIAHLVRRLEELDALQVRGGFVELEVLAGTWDIDPGALGEAARRLAAENDRFGVETVGGREILKRGRLSGPASRT